MEENKRRQEQQEGENNPTRLSDNLNRRINKSTDDLDEKSSAVGKSVSDRSSGLSTKDGLTGSDLDGQVTH